MTTFTAYTADNAPETAKPSSMLAAKAARQKAIALALTGRDPLTNGFNSCRRYCNAVSSMCGRRSMACAIKKGMNYECAHSHLGEVWPAPGLDDTSLS